MGNRVQIRVAVVCAAALAVLGVAGCSREATLAPDLAGVYGRIVDAREDYERGVALLLAGDDVAGENLLAAASTRMAVAIRECARTPGCDASVVALSSGEIAAKHDSIEGYFGSPRISELTVAVDTDADPDRSLEELAPSPRIETVSLLHGTELDDLIPRNPRVQAELNAWLTWKRPELIGAYRNYAYFRDQVAPIYENVGLPEALLFAMMATESGGKVHAFSRAGAAGPLQFMPATARRYGLYGIDGFDTRLDPARATDANARYVLDHLARLRGNLELTLAAYNVGEGRMGRIHRRHPDAEFWDPEVYYVLPFETRSYVPRVLAAALLFLHPDRYGVAFPELESTVTTVRLGAPASLGELAVCLENAPGEDGWFRTLRNLNPAISPGDRIPEGTRIVLPTAVVAAYGERCVAGDAPTMRIARELHDADYPETPEVLAYTVRRGDSLAVIAQEHRSSVRELASLNRIRPPYVIHPGQQLSVPARR